ncbi:MAG: transglycosylase SLT domain-containing protein [Gammaproteobacteria bacterium]|jgi:membrane-bound lytic murein transglycosylase F|tara:strand:+ start:167 stop:898 length:732 start_codon:yes stop_codon:yes gene_type:complete
MEKKNIFKLFLGVVCFLTMLGCEQKKEDAEENFSCEDNANSIYQNSSLNNFEKSKFDKLLNEKFLLYENLFKKAGEENNVEWELLAAISFQESQWDPRAKSNMGVRGMMMVTLETAAIVGVKNRLDPEQSINGGSKYIASLLEKNIFGKSQSDQLAISLASYNLGPTNIINIAQTIDKEPDQMIWEDFESVLKNLSGEDVNLVDKNGYKRGQQAIDYVHRVEDYYKLMIAYSCKDPIYQSSFL